ncbi:hypothetical protein EDC04DRAFT_712247 [Pisolithus marmoratus]|nr:hypothetical protein EDC04DRAFT_712247 [Pisolithus marmoratus]
MDMEHSMTQPLNIWHLLTVTDSHRLPKKSFRRCKRTVSKLQGWSPESQTLQESLRQLHFPSALDLTSNFDHDIADNERIPLFYNSPLPMAATQSVPCIRPICQHRSCNAGEMLSTPEITKSIRLFSSLAHDLRTTLRFPPPHAPHKPSPPLPTSVLTSLLATLTSLFRYLLIPSIHLDLLHRTWCSFHSALPKCNDRVQGAAAEVWAPVLRRLKTTKVGERALALMATELDDVEDARAWMLIFCLKVCITNYTRHLPLLSSPSSTITCLSLRLRPQAPKNRSIPCSDEDSQLSYITVTVWISPRRSQI